MDDREPVLEGMFNQAGFQQWRLNELMNVVNFCWINPIKFNESQEDYNYRVIFRSLTSFYTEIRPKLKSAEKEEIDNILDKLDSYIENNPIVNFFKNPSAYGSATKINRFEPKKWTIIKKNLINYQNKILDAADAHGLGNPSKDNPAFEVIN